MLLKLEPHIVEELVADDPVRPHISSHTRTECGSEVYGLYQDESAEILRAVICVAYTNEVPTNEYELALYSQAASQEGLRGNIAIFYTVWSYDRGAGRDIIMAVANEIHAIRYVTLSPLTEMAERFHLRNGAKLIGRYKDCQNFEYTL